MPSQTFENLKVEKKDRIQAALLHEFSTYGLPDAQVARIVKEAQIARGAFYKYFGDLEDAYWWLWRQALNQIHSKDELTGRLAKTPAEYTEQVRRFITQGEAKGLKDLITLHYTVNEAYLHSQPVMPPRFKAETWAVMTLTHQAVRECLLDEEDEEAILQRLETVLKKLLGGK
ncbi:TetR/AcrR family transcriptional regulator [Lactobacillus sp. 3B(2020)]|uniref:TetR/AcrR family transcriptional regulator n=1 Tax=Lactobacillus sp. 3B(2020) TaxID=2695882 RepID=UPI0015E04F17|nr:TetR/AcrR family transcriptional regulator [Lactobacillus sp. 3B(2020)]QLL70926.1 TetR family transcriptional regulator [Lactobacillus sp. 3B(2020)]